MSKAEVGGGLHRSLDALILRKNVSLCREQSSGFCPGFGYQSSKLRDG